MTPSPHVREPRWRRRASDRAETLRRHWRVVALWGGSAVGGLALGAVAGTGPVAAELGGSWGWLTAAILGGSLLVGAWGALVVVRRLANARRIMAETADRTAALEASEARFRRLLEAAPDAIVISNAEGRIVLMNAEAERLFGYPCDALLGAPVAMLMPERFRARHADHLRAYLANPTTRRMGDGANMFGRRHDGSEFPIETNLSLLSDHGRGLVTSVIRDLTPRREVQEREALLMRELNHRVKNTLASVQAIVTQTLRAAPTPEAFNAAVQARIIGLSKSHDVLTRNDWTGATVAEIVSEQLGPYRRDDIPFSLTGPQVSLRPNRAVTLGMVVGELATNAAKFGALSTDGTVSVEWTVRYGPDGPSLRLDWLERGGPPAAEPTKEGFGTRLIKRSLAAGLHGSSELSYAPEGLRAVLQFPLVEGEG